MKDNSLYQFKPHIPRMDFNELSRIHCHNTKPPVSDSSIKISRSSGNVFNNQFDSSMIVINRQSANIQMTNKQVLNIPIPTRSKHIILKRQSVFSFDILSEYKKSFLEENLELREHIKFLLKQIKKLKQSKSIDSNCSYNELFSKLNHEISTIKTQLKEKEERLYNLKRNYDQSNKENIALKENLNKRKVFNSKSLLLERKEHIELHSNKKDLVLNDLTTFEGINDDMTNVFSTSQQNYPLSPYYIKKIGVKGRQKKRESVNTSASTTLTVQPIVEKKLSLIKSYNCLYSLKSNETIIKFDMLNASFTTIDYIDNGNMNMINNQQAITLNASNGLFILGGLDCDQLLFYDAISNTVNKLQQSLYPHKKGSMILSSNFLCEQRLICLGSDKDTKVEMYQMDVNKWAELPEMTTTNGIASRIDTGYLIVNTHQLIAFFGFDPLKKTYINSIDYLSLSNPIGWTQIIVDIQSFQRGTLPLLRNHTVFNTKYDSANNTQMIYLFGGHNSLREANIFLGINIRSDLSNYSLIPNATEQLFHQEVSSYVFSSPLYEYINQGANKRKYKYAFDTNSNIHIIDTEIMKHEVITYL